MRSLKRKHVQPVRHIHILASPPPDSVLLNVAPHWEQAAPSFLVFNCPNDWDELVLQVTHAASPPSQGCTRWRWTKARGLRTVVFRVLEEPVTPTAVQRQLLGAKRLLESTRELSGGLWRGMKRYSWTGQGEASGSGSRLSVPEFAETSKRASWAGDDHSTSDEKLVPPPPYSSLSNETQDAGRVSEKY